MLVIIQCHYNVMNKLAKHKKDSTKIREERKMDPRSKKNYGNI